MRGRVRWWLHAKPTLLLDTLLADPDGVLSSVRSVARESAGRKRFYRLQGDPEEPALFVKVFTLPTLRSRLRYWLRPSKARREAKTAKALLGAGFDVAAPVAVGEERVGGALLRSFSVVPERRAWDLRALLLKPGFSGDAP